MVKHAEVLIPGSGPVGYTATIYAARVNLNPVLATGLVQGGQLTTTTDVENWPADKEHLQGPELMQRFLEHAECLKTEVLFDRVHAVHPKEEPIRLVGDSGEYTYDALIVSTGVSAQHPSLPSEETFTGRGVSAYATCDGFLYRGQEVAVAGGGSTAMEEALYLANIASKVMLIYRRDKFRAEPVLIGRLHEWEKKGRIEIKTNMVLDEILGDEPGVMGVRLKGTYENEGKTGEIKPAGVFIVIGHKPNTDTFRGQLDTNDTGYIRTGSGLDDMAIATNIPGVFAAGGMQDHIYRQAITSAGTGCMAVLDAQRYLEGLE